MVVRKLSARHSWQAYRHSLPRAMRPKSCWKPWMRFYKARRFFRRECVEKRAFREVRLLAAGSWRDQSDRDDENSVSRRRWKPAGNWSYRRGAGGGRGVRLLRDARIGVLPRRRGKKVLAARNRKWPYLRLVLFR